jgi:polyisoprenoid-binding protein YceI
MSRILRVVLITAVGVGVLGSGVASSRTKLIVEPDDSQSRVQFVSDAPLEKITGVGHALKGDIELDPGAIAATSGKVELDVASIRTNIDLRDEHLRGPDWLDAKKFPTIKFEIKKVEGASSLTPDAAVEVKVHGKLTMHGVTRDETATATVRWQQNEGIRLQAQFKVNLTHYKISVPALVRLKVSDEIGLNVMLKIKPKSSTPTRG